jgi:5'-nucleotidase
MKKGSIILVDMDGTLNDFLLGRNRWLEEHKDKFHPHLKPISPEEKTTFFIEEMLPEKLRSSNYEMYTQKGFFYSLPIIPGAKEALNYLVENGMKVFICTIPLHEFKNCVSEKYQWIEDNLGKNPKGEKWTDKIIFTHDKTLIKGDILIDDNPTPKGEKIPEWEHILYELPFNKNIKNKRKLTWKNYKKKLNV